MNADPVSLAEAFAGAVNRHDAGAMADLMTADHVFVDSDGTEVRGRERMRSGWVQYFSMFPDYRIEVRETFSRGPVAVLIGWAEGTCAVAGELRAENHWRVPAVWRAVAGDGALREWRVYVNVEPIVKIVERCTR